MLDSIDPARINAVERAIDPGHTLVILASKSGSTLEPNILKQHFFERIRGVVGPIEIGRRFIAITDPGSKMQHLSEADGFRRIFFGQPTIGGRFSVLSDFGMVPAAIMGLDVARLLGQAEQMAHSCAASVPVTENPGLMLGVLMGVAARQGHTKVTLIASPGAQPLGTWIEQLMSASLGKTGGLLAIEGEPVGSPASYGSDRLFVYLRFDPAPDSHQDAAVAALEAAGLPVVRITLADPYELGGEFFRWQFATAVAGAVLGLNPFDQPDIEASKMASRRHTNEFSTDRLAGAGDAAAARATGSCSSPMPPTRWSSVVSGRCPVRSASTCAARGPATTSRSWPSWSRIRGRRPSCRPSAA